MPKMLGLASSGPENDEVEVEREANEEDSANSSGNEVGVTTAAWGLAMNFKAPGDRVQGPLLVHDSDHVAEHSGSVCDLSHPESCLATMEATPSEADAGIAYPGPDMSKRGIDAKLCIGDGASMQK
jgi:hypothetical protein